MVFWQGILIVLGCIAVGFLVGLGLLRVLRRKKEKEYSLSNKETATVRTKDAEVPVAAKSNNTITKSNGYEDPLEILLINHKNGLAVEKSKPSITAVNPASVEVVNQKTEPVIKKEEKPAPHIMRWQELVTPGNPLMQDEYEKTSEMPVVKEPVAVDQASPPLAAEPAKAATISILEESAIINQQTTPVKEKPKKAAKTHAPEKPETTNQKHPPAVQDKKKDTKPVLPGPVIVKPESIPASEKDQKSTEPPQVQESADVEPKITPVPEKQAGILKTDLILEIEGNLAIAGRPISGKMVPFQTKCWDSKHGESDLFLNAHYQDLIQLYVDIGLANNIVWLATEINHRSKELDESYVRLCSGIVENIKKILG
jgi:hypothetical protein